MMPRNLGALFCGMAAVALLVAGFMPWFATEANDDDDDDRGSYQYRRIADEDSLDEDRSWGDMRANFGLVSAEVCVRLQCKSVKYTGAKGMADDAFAWLGRATLGAALSGVALLIATALAARNQRRPILRGWAVSVVGTAAGLGAAFASIQAVEGIAGYVERGMGLSAVVVGAALAGLGAAFPWGPTGEPNPLRRYGLAAAVCVLAVLGWFTLLQHAWWHSGRSLDVLQTSPLGVEICDGGDCRLASSLGTSTRLRVLACLTSLCAAALIAPAFGTAARVARGIAPGAWAWVTAALAWLALAFGLATWASYPSSDIMVVAWGLPVFAVAMAGSGAASVVAVILMRTRDHDEPFVPATAAAVLPPGAVAPGARPVLVALSSTPTVPAVPMVPVYIAAEPAFVMAAVTPVVPAPLPQARALPAAAVPPRGPTAAALLAKRTSPMCPTCRVATLWHSKRGAWWCSTCKQIV